MRVNDLTTNQLMNSGVKGITETAARLKHRTNLGVLNRLARKMVIAQLQKLKIGRVILVEQFNNLKSDAKFSFGQLSENCTLDGKIIVHNPQFYSDLAFGGSIGAGESYMLGHWSSDSLTNVVRIFAVNAELSDDMEPGMASLVTLLRKSLHWLNRNSKSGSRKNISAHYDIGNDLFALFLDPTMMYSCGIFPNEQSDMREASLAKLERICKSLDLQPSDHILEIGSGWGGLAIYAAENYGCRVTTTTISKQQFDLALQRVWESGLQDKITVLLQDYRDLQGQFDKLVSIEMIEAVGYAYYDIYFEKCSSLLKPNGAMLIQAITIADQRYEKAKRSVDFIQKYIFPGSCIPSNTALLQSVTRVTDMKLLDLTDIGLHYATTLRKWREQFFENIESVRKLGYGEQFIRMWEFYLCYCEGGFQERVISDIHMLLTKPQSRLTLI